MTTLSTRRRCRLSLLAAAVLIAAACSSRGNPAAPTTVSTATAPGTAATATPPAGAPAPEEPAQSPAPPPAPQAARYRFTFDVSWSAATHPQDFPSDAHFSPLVGATHAASVRFWQEGTAASDGVRDMAERGRTTPLDSEVRAAITAGAAQFLLLGGNIARSPGSVSLEFDVTQSHPLVTLVSMVAPSPDWFTGVSGVPLLDNGQWVDRLVLELGPWDAGTDSGTTFTSPDQVTQPRQPVSPITGFPFLRGGQVAPIARFTFQRIA
jgi:hypothetical protein